MATESSTSPRPKSETARLGIYGDLPTRGVSFATRYCPGFIEPVILFGFSVVSFLLCKTQRRAVMHNLSVLSPEANALQIFGEAFTVFYEFSRSISDAAYVRCGRDMLTWQIQNRPVFDQLEKHHENGAILLTAHMGNYDIAGTIFSEKFPAPVHSVRAPEKNPRTQEAKERELAAETKRDYVIHYNKGSEELLGMELAKALSAGEYVAIQGDRVMFDVSAIDAPVPNAEGNVSMKIPAGPFVLSQITGAPIYPVFVKRTAHRTYCVIAGEPFSVKNNRKKRAEYLDEGVGIWMQNLLAIIRPNRTQWLMFESAFSERAEGLNRVRSETQQGWVNDLTGFSRETVRGPLVRPMGFWESHIGAGAACLLFAGACLGFSSSWWMWLLLPVILFLAFNFLGAFSSVVAAFCWPDARTPSNASSFVATMFLTFPAMLFLLSGGFFLKIISIPWLLWVLVRVVRASIT